MPEFHPLPSQMPQILLAILTDLSMDHRCFKVATSLRDAGFEPIILCDQPRQTLGPAWQSFTIRKLTSVSHLDRFGLAFTLFHIRLAGILLTTSSALWISLDCPPLLTMAVIGKLRRKTVVYDSHELFTQTPLVLSRPSRRRFWNFWHNTGLRLVQHVISVSPTCMAWFQLHFPGHRLFLLPNAPPLHREAPLAKAPVSIPRLVFQGGLRVASGLPETFIAMRGLPQWTLDLYGNGPERASLTLAAQQAGLADRTVFHGQIPFEALREPMAQAHIGIHLMQPVCESFALTLANKLFDYVHAGLPVLLSDNPAHRAFLAKHKVGIAVDSYSPEAIAAGLKTLAEGWPDFHEACLIAREEWHWQAFAQGLPAFFKS